MNVDKYVVEKAAEHVAALLSPLGKRWRHVQGVVQRAYSVRTLFEEEDQQYLIAAALSWLLRISVRKIERLCQ